MHYTMARHALALVSLAVLAGTAAAQRDDDDMGYAVRARCWCSVLVLVLVAVAVDAHGAVPAHPPAAAVRLT